MLRDVHVVTEVRDCGLAPVPMRRFFLFRSGTVSWANERTPEGPAPSFTRGPHAHAHAHAHAHNQTGARTHPRTRTDTRPLTHTHKQTNTGAASEAQYLAGEHGARVPAAHLHDQGHADELAPRQRRRPARHEIQCCALSFRETLCMLSIVVKRCPSLASAISLFIPVQLLVFPYMLAFPHPGPLSVALTRYCPGCASHYAQTLSMPV